MSKEFNELETEEFDLEDIDSIMSDIEGEYFNNNSSNIVEPEETKEEDQQHDISFEKKEINSLDSTISDGSSEESIESVRLEYSGQIEESNQKIEDLNIENLKLKEDIDMLNKQIEELKTESMEIINEYEDKISFLENDDNKIDHNNEMTNSLKIHKSFIGSLIFIILLFLFFIVGASSFLNENITENQDAIIYDINEFYMEETYTLTMIKLYENNILTYETLLEYVNLLPELEVVDCSTDLCSSYNNQLNEFNQLKTSLPEQESIFSVRDTYITNSNNIDLDTMIKEAYPDGYEENNKWIIN